MLLLLHTLQLNASFNNYKNGQNKAKLDHCIISNDRNDIFANSFNYNDEINLSDQKPLMSMINSIIDKRYRQQLIPTEENENLIKLIPNWEWFVFGNNRYNAIMQYTNFILNGLPLSFSHNIKYLGIEFNNNLDFSYFFISNFFISNFVECLIHFIH